MATSNNSRKEKPYISRDVGEILPRVDKILFADFVRAAACRVGQLLNVHSIASDVGVSDDTAKRWLGVLVQSDVIIYLRPYANNLMKRIDMICKSRIVGILQAF